MRPVVLAILDGWGYSKDPVGNAITQANTPIIDGMFANYPSLLLQASGSAVGLSWGEPGNSEVGHLALGSGRIIQQYFPRINKDIDSDAFFENEALRGAISHVQSNDSNLHIVGLLTSGSVHAYFGHLTALLELARRNDMQNVSLHLFTDGKDSGLKEAPKLFDALREEINTRQVGRIASVIGRDIAMDRVNDWSLTQKTFELLVHGIGEKASDIQKQLTSYYEKDFNDQTIPPTVCIDAKNSDKEAGRVQDDDAIIFFNFREDRMRQLTRVFLEEDSKYFKKVKPKNLYVVSFTPTINHPNLHVAFRIPYVANGLNQVLHMAKRKQFHIAEMEKYAHVTYFFNGLKEDSPDTETDIILESYPDIVTQPEMRAPDIGNRVLEELRRGIYNFILINFANADMLAHTGNLEAAQKGVEVIDAVLGTLKDEVLNQDGFLLVTADHGNVESLTYRGTGQIETKHNQNPVPFYVVAKGCAGARSPEELAQAVQHPQGLLADIAPTVLELMNVPKPVEMTGKSLLPLLGCEELRA